MRITLLYSAGSRDSPPALRMKYLKDALIEEGFEVKEMNLPKSRLTYLSPQKIIDDVVLYSTPPAYVALAAGGVRLVGDLRDPWDVYAEEGGPLKRLTTLPVVALYLRKLRRSRLLVATTQSIAEHYERLTGKRVLVVENGTDPELLKCEGGERRLGAVLFADFSNPYLPLRPFLSVAREVGLKLTAVGPGSEKYGGIGRVSYERLKEVGCKRSIGIIPRPWRGRTYEMTIPLKTYDYMALGLCIFAYGPPRGELKRLVEEEGIGVYAGSPDELGEKLKECLEVCSEAGARARRLAEEKYNRRLLSRRYASYLASSL